MSNHKTTQRTNKLLRDRGYMVRITEHYIDAIKRKRDLYGFIDVVGLHPAKFGVLGVQTTTGDHLAERVKKAEALPAYWQWLACGNEVEFHGWRKILKVKGGKAEIWQPRIIKVSFQDVLFNQG